MFLKYIMNHMHASCTTCNHSFVVYAQDVLEYAYTLFWETHCAICISLLQTLVSYHDTHIHIYINTPPALCISCYPLLLVVILSCCYPLVILSFVHGTNSRFFAHSISLYPPTIPHIHAYVYMHIHAEAYVYMHTHTSCV